MQLKQQIVPLFALSIFVGHGACERTPQKANNIDSASKIKTDQQKIKENEQVLVVCVDYDGCLAQGNSISSHSGLWSLATLSKIPDNLIQDNKLLLDYIKLSVQNCDDVIIMCGSARQDVYLDHFNGKNNKNGLALVAIPHIANYIKNHIVNKNVNVYFDGYLTTDALLHMDSRITYNKATVTECFKGDKIPSYDIPHDESKMLISYLYMHRIAAKYSNKLIHFTFIDDRNDIIEHLFQLYNKHPDLVPANLKLSILRYTGRTTPSLYNHTILGKGDINLDLSSASQFIAPLGAGNLLSDPVFASFIQQLRSACNWSAPRVLYAVKP